MVLQVRSCLSWVLRIRQVFLKSNKHSIRTFLKHSQRGWRDCHASMITGILIPRIQVKLGKSTYLSSEHSYYGMGGGA